MKKFELNSLRLTELEQVRREYLNEAPNPSSILWVVAERMEEAIQAKLANRFIDWRHGWVMNGLMEIIGLVHCVPDSERIYLTPAERVLAMAAKSLPMAQVEANRRLGLDATTLEICQQSQYLARHPEIQEEAYVYGIAPDGTEELFLEKRPKLVLQTNPDQFLPR